MVRVRHCLFFPFPFPSFSCLFLYSSFSFSFPFFPVLFPSFFISFFVSFSVPFPFVFLSFSFRFLFPFPFPCLSLSFSFLFPFPLPFLCFPFPSFTIPFPFPRSCEFFDQGVKPALGKTIRGKNKTITSGKTIQKGSGFLQDLMCCCCLLGISITYDANHVLNQRVSRDDIFRCSTMLNWPEAFSEKSGPLWNYQLVN